ncbi:hypothetical protein J2801_003616 [Paraburkholderia phenoliruptrix]|uniref:hypothetical protein n=1 Tax=Paraburkholderia phenoliruptrix TaxID=252970 RepID=UPI00285CE1F6|nr:hypothetical protein [Paraburkholderia phenoliruptrix]MDR6421328.1 hypothetical protein [Paraburkholderia phenoliruptrix]
MSEIKDGGPAFPQQCDHPMAFVGLSLRDYFAAKAMQGLVAASGDGATNVSYDDESVAKSAYELADAMLRAREKS